jgi:hypothetical protein
MVAVLKIVTQLLVLQLLYMGELGLLEDRPWETFAPTVGEQLADLGSNLVARVFLVVAHCSQTLLEVLAGLWKYVPL